MSPFRKTLAEPICNLEAEQSVLGAILIRPELLDEVADLLKPEDFYRASHALIYEVMLALAQKNEPIDLKTVTMRLKSLQKLDVVGGPVFLAELSEQVGFATNAPYYAKVVKDKARIRTFKDVLMKTIPACHHPIEDAGQFLDSAENQIFQAVQDRSSVLQPLSVLVHQEVERVEALRERPNSHGVSSGFIDIDNVTSGFQHSNLTIIAARPSMGKTALALNIAHNAAIRDTPVMIFSLEMSNAELIQRLLASAANINLVRLRNGLLSEEEWGRLRNARKSLENIPIFLDETPLLSPLEIRSRARRLKARHGISLIIVDYLQLIKNSEGKTREQEVAGISRSLKALAKELRLPIVALSQLSRRCEERTDKRPMLSDLRESGAIEQDSDLVMFLYRDEIYNRNNPLKGLVEVHIAKNRNGPTAKVDLLFDAPTLKFKNFLKTPIKG